MVIVLTGEPGAGKSTAAQWFAEQGAALIDADKIVHELWQGGVLLQKAVERWGVGILSEGHIDKKAVADRIFTDDAEYRWLCDAVHPLVQAEMKRRLPREGIAVAEIPMFFESERPDWVDKVLFMTADADARASRNSFRGLNAAEIARREKFFIGREQRMAQSDWVICNNGDVAGLERQLETVWREVQELQRIKNDTRKVILSNE